MLPRVCACFARALSRLREPQSPCEVNGAVEVPNGDTIGGELELSEGELCAVGDGGNEARLTNQKQERFVIPQPRQNLREHQHNARKGSKWCGSLNKVPQPLPILFVALIIKGHCFPPYVSDVFRIHRHKIPHYI